MAHLSAMAYKASELLQLIEQLKEGPVNYNSFCDNFELTRNQHYKFLQTLIDMGLLLNTGERYSKKNRAISLLSDENLNKIVEELEAKAKIKITKVAPKKSVRKGPKLIGADRFSVKNISDVIVYLKGTDRPKKDILIDLERVMRPKTDKEKSLIIKTYELWRNNYMKYEV